MCTPPRFFPVHPPLCPCTEKQAAFRTAQNPPDFTGSNCLRKSGCPERRIAVNRDTFRKFRFGKCHEFLVPLHRSTALASLRTGS